MRLCARARRWVTERLELVVPETLGARAVLAGAAVAGLLEGVEPGRCCEVPRMVAAVCGVVPSMPGGGDKGGSVGSGCSRGGPG